MPVWAVLLTVLVTALGAAGIGGVVGGRFAAQTAAPEQVAPQLDNEPPSGAPSRAPDTIAGISQRVSPSVVSIQDSGAGLSGNGSGFVIAGDHVVTNNHVAAALEDGLEVVYSDGRTSAAEIVGTRPESDLAVLELRDPIDVEPLEFGDSDQATVGDEVIAIGAPLGLAGTVTTGIISAVDRPVRLGEGSEAAIEALQTDAAINPGNSGGPLVDLQGRVIGVNSAIATMGGPESGQSGSIGLGFAIPSADAEDVVHDILGGDPAARADLGADLDPGHANGARVEAVEPGGPADRAGLRAGDVVVEFDGEPVDDAEALTALLAEHQPRDRVAVGYERDGESHRVDITLGTNTN
ncbi:S1C family serine protease [Nocardiopsis trehalosi]|uniref:S1C family serine protease n=1 Tax=Nocardiopsis trehalosi TaxID=109329 RepID=UPI00082A83AA|nr:trypsin-like peptidase domain-containing protein [Nocardiopsis trehalosi]